MSIGERIKFFRKQQTMTQVQLAERASLSRSYLADVEGNRYNPSVDTLKSIAKALHIEVHQLLDEQWNQGNAEPRPITSKEERDIAKDLERIMSDLESGEALAFHGEPIDEESKELLRISLENSMRLAKQMAKQKFTPKKYRKE
ncbi:helix-turn-helix domain-containing protein [Paenibacillus allorhizosphaerae]|uniref:HTH cro/C1-type domain-containing protein n=1 Tax=Paenibacillus allorhizosphaerae TaxID=2849866 RepID=A0ABN7TR64_9BACL|nr:helix-turn-helix transcriptional regulator [Paenibacillus allorhizosphaerae]CAG7647389.1 hypothetical protein PAECIP111802_03962 [Paenibacillus allorhizosphaerae]